MDWLFGSRYRLWIINTTSQFSIYSWEKWSLLLPSIDLIVKLSKDSAYIRTFQSFVHENKWLGFGRMKWNEDNNWKWTNKYRSKEYSNRMLSFYGTEIWAPDWNQCCKVRITPKIFIQVYHYPNIEKIREGIVLALPKKIAEKNEIVIESGLKEILKLIPNSTLSVKDRYWTPSRNFPNRIEDINNLELEKIIYNA
jgi:hypothetical protein